MEFFLCVEFEQCEGGVDMSGLGAFKRLNSAQLTDHHGWMDGIVAATPYLFFYLPLAFHRSHVLTSHLPDTFYLHPTSYLSVTPINLFIHCLYFAVSVSPLGPLFFSLSLSPSLSHSCFLLHSHFGCCCCLQLVWVLFSPLYTPYYLLLCS